MSATYRIDLMHDPHSSRYPWDAVVVRLSDNKRMTIEVAASPGMALERAREFVRVEEGAPNHSLSPVVFVDDQGRDAEAPQSVKVP